ncbi:MAG: ABC transporter permease subunit [Dehalococcoidia bacterium]|nr:ABC transporter permease subunit [Dehalococcoidia bacterium]
MKQILKNIWFRNRSRSLAVNLIVGAVAGIVVGYFVYSIAVNLFDFDFLFGPYGSPDRSSIFVQLDVEASDARWVGILKGAGNTISVVFFAIILSSLLGLAVGVARLSTNPMVTRLGGVYVELFRNLPLLLIMFFFAFAVFRSLPRIEEKAGWDGVLHISNRGLAIPWPETTHSLWWLWLVLVVVGAVAALLVRRVRMRREDLTGETLRPNTWAVAIFLVIGVGSYAALLAPVRVSLPEVTQSASGFFGYTGGNLLGLGYLSALVSLTLYFSAFMAEIVRGSIQSVPRGQTEAAASMGLTAYQQFTLIILPQALRTMIPSLNNEYQNANKDSTLAHAIAYGEIVLISNRIVNNSGNLLQTYLFIFFVFIVTNLVISLIMNTINRNVQIK